MDKVDGIYLHFPNYYAGTRGAAVVGGIDLGAALGNVQIPVGHAASIIFSPTGEVSMYEYGRYRASDEKVIGKKLSGRGNWRRITLPNRHKGESS